MDDLLKNRVYDKINALSKLNVISVKTKKSQ